MIPISTSEPVARKEHECNYCGGIIKKGEKYERQFLVYDYAYSWKAHLRCQSIASELDMFDSCDDGVDYDHFHESIQCEYADLYAKLHPDSYETDPIPSFLEQLDFVCIHRLKSNP